MLDRSDRHQSRQLREKTSAIYQKLMNDLSRARSASARSDGAFRGIVRDHFDSKLAVLVARFGLDSALG
jgi:hypothetical protein